MLWQQISFINLMILSWVVAAGMSRHVVKRYARSGGPRGRMCCFVGSRSFAEPRRATTQWTRGTAVARKEKYPVAPFLEFRPHWKADFFLPEVTGWGLHLPNRLLNLRHHREKIDDSPGVSLLGVTTNRDHCRTMSPPDEGAWLRRSCPTTTNACCRSLGTAAGGADVDRGHGHVSIEKMQMVLDLDGGRGLLRSQSAGAGRCRRLLYWKDRPAESQKPAQEEEKDEQVILLTASPSPC